MNLKDFVKKKLEKDKTGHDYNHALRVLKIAKQIAKHYKNIDYKVLEASCLLHDIAFQNGVFKDHHNMVGAKECKPILRRFRFSEDKIQEISRCILNHIGIIGTPPENPKNTSIEAHILRDADNIDALGAIGIIRYIEFANSRGYSYFKTKKAGWNGSIYSGIKELMTWPDKMLTKEGKIMGKKRLKIMKDFLKQMGKEL